MQFSVTEGEGLALSEGACGELIDQRPGNVRWQVQGRVGVFFPQYAGATPHKAITVNTNIFCHIYTIKTEVRKMICQ